MSSEAIAAGVVRTRISSLRRLNPKAQEKIARPHDRHPLLIQASANVDGQAISGQWAPIQLAG